MFRGKKIAHIVAVGQNGEIGKDNSLLWSITEDLKYFREKTLGHVVLMGRNTIESLPKPLTRRYVLEVSEDSANNFVGGFCERVKKEDALALILDVAVGGTKKLNTDIIFIAGGGQLYKSTEDIVDQIYLTRVNETFDGADTFYKIPLGFVLKGYTQKPVTTSSGTIVTFELWEKLTTIK